MIHALPRVAADFMCRVGPKQNQLLAALPRLAYERVHSFLEPVSLRVGEHVESAEHGERYAYFPTTAIVSLQQSVGQGPAAEIAVVGRDGMFGISIFTGGFNASNSAYTHCSGNAFRMAGAALQREFSASPPFRSLMLRYAQVRIAQIAQNAVCYRHHSVEQQVCRRLLMNLDRLISWEIPITHDLLAGTLGVRREAVTLAMRRLHQEGLISCHRGRVSILDVRAVWAASCECYAALNKETARLLPFRPATAAWLDPPDPVLSFKPS